MQASYIISTEHKEYLTEAGPRKIDLTRPPCPRSVTREEAEVWLRKAIGAGHVGAPWIDQPYPQYAWYRDGEPVYEARLSNAEMGAYKGYPLDPSEWPAWLS